MAKDEKLGEAHVDITGNLTPLKRAMISAKGIVRKAMSTLVTIVKRGAIVMGVALGFSIFKMIRAASAAEEIQAKFGTVFRELTKQANDWAESYGKSVGRATQDVKKWMAGLQDLFVPLGMTRDAAFKLDKELVKLAVDVASFNNQADEDVIRDFTSALVGNHETIRKYGIIISEASLKQEAFNQGIKKTFSELSNLEKVQLRYALIVRGSTDAQGDAIRTGDSFANQIKRLKANITDFWQTAGTRFLENVNSIVTQTNAWFTSNSKLVGQKFGDWLADLSKNAKHLGEDLSIVIEGLKGLGEGISNVVKIITALSPLGKIAKAFSGFTLTNELKEARAEADRLQAILDKKLLGKEKTPTPKSTTPDMSATEVAAIAKANAEAEAKAKVAAEAKAKNIAAALKIDATEMPKDVETSIRASFIPLTEMWRTLSGGTKKINERILDINQKQLDETKRMRDSIESGFEKQNSGWVS